MKTCERCGKRFNPREEEDEFESLSCGMRYDCVIKCLCAECASAAIDDYEEGIYIETCSKCGCKYDIAKAHAVFDDRYPGSANCVYSLVMCADCASDYEEELLSS